MILPGGRTTFGLFFLFLIVLAMAYCFTVSARDLAAPKLSRVVDPLYLSAFHNYLDAEDFEDFLESSPSALSPDSLRGFAMQSFYDGTARKDMLARKDCGGPLRDGKNCANPDWMWLEGKCVKAPCN